MNKSYATEVGNAKIINLCNFPIFVWSTANETNTTTNFLPANNGFYTENYRFNPNGGGISLKIATVPVDTVITQFEYTYTANNPNVYYDISNINGYPFQQWGFKLIPSISSCPSVFCAPGPQPCTDVYNLPDDIATKSCDLSTDLSFSLCS